MPHVEVNGIRLYFEEDGTGPPLLLIAGLGANRLSWATVVPALRDQYRCITFDNRGVGKSDVPPGPYEMDTLGDDAAALIDHLGVGPVDCVGWSMGGSVLQSLMINHPQHVKRGVLLSTLPSYSPLQHKWLDALTFMRKHELDPVALAVIGMPWGTTARSLYDHDKRYELAKLVTQMPDPTTYEGFHAQGEAIRNYDSRPRLGDVRTPTLVLVGAEDVLTPPSQAVEMASRIPGAQLKVLPRGSHGMVIEYPDDTLAEIRAFLTNP
ncbi:MAG: alpha/beta fold hydrolase [Chloroflexi bacterium]|nr:alpha/beta fold hydrolase [Chloroflexota bacterium]